MALPRVGRASNGVWPRQARRDRRDRPSGRLMGPLGLGGRGGDADTMLSYLPHCSSCAGQDPRGAHGTAGASVLCAFGPTGR